MFKNNKNFNVYDAVKTPEVMKLKLPNQYIVFIKFVVHIRKVHELRASKFTDLCEAQGPELTRWLLK